MDKFTVNWKGYIPAISTPFLRNGDLDIDGWENLLTWLVDEGMHGLVINGTTGEWFSQSLEDVTKLFHTASKVVKKRIPIIAGCTGYTAQIVIQQAKIAEEADLDGVLIALPPYIVPTHEEIINYYETISEAIELPICIYNWPRGTNVDMDKDLIKKLAKIDKVVAIKNSTPNLQNFISTFFAVRDKLRYFGFPMNELGLSLIRDYGGDGLMGAGAVLGRVHPNFFNYLWEGKEEKALACGRKDQFLFENWFNKDFSAKFGSPQAIVKVALNVQGLPGGYPREPILPLTKEQEKKVADIVSKAKQLQ